MRTTIDHYPRPLLRRDSFFSLDGIWTCNGQKIRVPFPKESPLSLYEDHGESVLNYEKTFTLPDGFYHKGERVLLHFGAVDQIADVTLNERFLTCHEGGYLPFTIDITDYLSNENKLTVTVTDELDLFYPYGKQTKNPHGMWYTPVSGIWQSVWIEALPQDGIRELLVETDDHSLTLDIVSDAPSFTLRLPLDKEIIERTFTEKHVTIDLSGYEKRLWSPEDPVLYDFTLSTGSETVSSYLGFRKLEVREIRGYQKLFLNGKPLFLNGLLDQGYWNDGIFLPEDFSKIEAEVADLHELGYNFLRKHIKIEPEEWYYQCDKHGILVMQDMVNSGPYSFFVDTILPTVGIPYKKEKITDKRRYDFFLDQARETIRHLKSHPSLFAYTIYNEGWGQQGASKAYEVLKKEDPSRLFDSASGWFKTEKTDFDSYHIYFRNKVLPAGKKLLFLSECGGFTRKIEGHAEEKKSYGYGKTDSEEGLTDAIEKMHEKMVLPSIRNGLVGVVMTQVSDVEGEINGLYTYDRTVCKVDRTRIRKLNEKLQKAYEEALDESR